MSESEEIEVVVDVVPLEDKIAAFLAIQSEYLGGSFFGWDQRTFSSLQDYVDANIYIADVFDRYGVRGANETIEWLERAWGGMP